MRFKICDRCQKPFISRSRETCYRCAPVIVINMWEPCGDCVVCGEVSFRSGIPMYEDMVLHNDYEGEWGGQPACDRCREFQGLLTEPMELERFQAFAFNSQTYQGLDI